MYKYLICFIYLLASVALYGNSPIPNAADSLKENAVAIVENFEASFIQSDLNNATYKETKVITVLNKQGDRYANFYINGDNFRELKDFSGVIKNSSGTVIKKIGKKDLTISSISQQMATDMYSIVYECKVPTYPYTIEYSYQEKWKNGIIFYPSFSPIEGYMQSVKNASYTIEVPANINLRSNINFDCNSKDEVVGNKHIYSFSAKNLKAINSEPLSPPFRDLYPRVLIAPSNFCYDSQCGDMTDWKGYGIWLANLLKGRDILPEDVSNNLKNLVKDAKSDEEKVEILYKYLQSNSRYVSIQLGIGGFQPIPAATVMKSGFGDCKGLSNVMKAMLNTVGISSNYCEIYSGERKHFTKDFSNIQETNHAILMVPLKNDSLWLECTSQTLPFGYIHNNIAGHDVLVVTDSGEGKLCRVPTYSDEQNKQFSNLIINISEDGIAKGNMVFTNHLHSYASSVHYMTSKDRTEVIEYINQNMKLPKIQIDNIQVTENKTTSPSCSLSADFSAQDFVNKTGTRLFIPICPLNKGSYNIFSSNVRNLDIQINNGFSESDSITINIPKSYTVESLPKDISVKTPFGILKAQIKIDGNKIVYTQNIDIFTGKYSKENYNEIKAFFAEISQATKRKLVLKKI
ncbi:DUF3857 domain-containing protein [Dysgonomonas sp. Marseille-P4677]|uniref:DUF3857 domain-containing protein n=1 Tax=Dysgonomonas sp. Marseille-P4677 TaxID=2364790 RepID=UPI0019113C12|nr:DUF3857 domain-containing protein [Dysgonomonas sp. Marseille-P4677]MBK5722807.1 DUF3857 domain-containing protein [Dysgonomonas sp. Marseille-P4677]